MDLAKRRGGSARCRWRRESPTSTAKPIARSSPHWATSRSGTIFCRRRPSGFWPLGCSNAALARLRAGSGLCRSLPLHVLAVQTDEIDRIEHQWRETTVADCGRDDLAREREQPPRTLDHDQRMQVFLGYVDDAEHAGIGEFEAEHHLAGVFSLAF